MLFPLRTRPCWLKKKKQKNMSTFAFSCLFPDSTYVIVTRRRDKLWLVPSNFPPYSNFRRGVQAVVIYRLLSLYKPCQFPFVWKFTFGCWTTEKCAATAYKTQHHTKWRKMKNFAVQFESCVEYLRGRVSSVPPRSLRVLSGEIHPRSKCNVCVCVVVVVFEVDQFVSNLNWAL